MRRRLERRDQRMVLQELGERAAQLAGAVPVNDTQIVLIGDGGFVEEFLERA